jgi:Lrp/AsnC family leucine-responsive transcriptional regulator
MKEIYCFYFIDERDEQMIDAIDIEIIRCLQSNSRIQWKQIGEQIHMTGQAVANRIQRLEELGVIEGYTVTTK